MSYVHVWPDSSSWDIRALLIVFNFRGPDLRRGNHPLFLTTFFALEFSCRTWSREGSQGARELWSFGTRYMSWYMRSEKSNNQSNHACICIPATIIPIYHISSGTKIAPAKIQNRSMWIVDWPHVYTTRQSVNYNIIEAPKLYRHESCLHKRQQNPAHHRQRQVKARRPLGAGSFRCPLALLGLPSRASAHDEFRLANIIIRGPISRQINNLSGV